MKFELSLKLWVRVRYGRKEEYSSERGILGTKCGDTQLYLCSPWEEQVQGRRREAKIIGENLF